MIPEKIKQLTPDGYGGDFEKTVQRCDKSAVFACKNVINSQKEPAKSVTNDSKQPAKSGSDTDVTTKPLKH